MRRQRCVRVLWEGQGVYLAEAQDTIERGDVHPKLRALAMRRLTGGAAIVAGRKAAPTQAKGRGKKP